jgi:hypothetical protein
MRFLKGALTFVDRLMMHIYCWVAICILYATLRDNLMFHHAVFKQINILVQAWQGLKT